MRQTKGGNMVIDHTSAHNLNNPTPSSRGEGSYMLCCYGANAFFVFLAYSRMGMPTTSSVRSAFVLWAFTFTPTVSPLSQGRA